MTNAAPLSPSLFRAYDIRGVAGETLTEEAVRRIGRGIGSAAAAQQEPRVVVGRDGRLSSPALCTALTAGLRDAGRDVIDLGLVPTPVLYFATHVLNSRSGVMVTGSHNPANYNGLKVVIAGSTLAGEEIQALRRRIEAEDFTSGRGGIETLDLLPRYSDRIVGDVILARGMKVVMDCGNGAAGVVAPQVFRSLGCDVVELFCDVDGTFPNHHPDPGKPENLESLIEAVKREQADFGLAFDGDGDRLGMVDSEGRVIWPDRQLMLFAADLLAREPGAEILYDIKCTRHLARWIAEHGGRSRIWKSGHSVMKAKLRETGAPLGGELSGHLFFGDRWYGFDDGIYAGARMAELLSRDCRPSAEVFFELPDSINTPELSIALAEGENFQFMERLRAVAEFPGAAITEIDGLRVDFPDGFGLVRASNTTPSLVIRFEADDAAALARIQQRFRELMRRIAPGLTLPF